MYEEHNSESYHDAKFAAIRVPRGATIYNKAGIMIANYIFHERLYRGLSARLQ